MQNHEKCSQNFHLNKPPLLFNLITFQSLRPELAKTTNYIKKDTEVWNECNVYSGNILQLTPNEDSKDEPFTNKICYKETIAQWHWHTHQTTCYQQKYKLNTQLILA